MATNQQTVDRAAYELGYIEYGASLDATDAGDALNAFNDMMHEWKYRDMDFNWFTQDTLSDVAPVPAWASSGVISNLAVRLGAIFNVAISPETVEKARVGKRTIGNTLMSQSLGNTDMTNLPLGERVGTRYQIESDSI